MWLCLNVSVDFCVSVDREQAMLIYLLAFLYEFDDLPTESSSESLYKFDKLEERTIFFPCSF